MAFFRCLVIVLVVSAGCFSGCRQKVTESPEIEPGTRLTLIERRLLEVIEKQQQLEALAAREDAPVSEVQRRFHEVARDYNSIVTDNPRHLETRLLYGKLLDRFGDREGARNQFLMAANIDPEVAVIHQQLSTYYAEEDDPTRALAYALNAIRIEPETATYHFGLGQLLTAFRTQFLAEEVFTVAELDEATLDAFATAASLEPETLAFQFRYGEAIYDQTLPDWERALAHWRFLRSSRGLSQLQAASLNLHEARCLIELGRYNEAVPLLDATDEPALNATREALRAALP
jgi:tetratricopeptide (TPR) repeat protein